MIDNRPNILRKYEKTSAAKEKEILEREAVKVLQSIPMPFGSLEKAKYEVRNRISKGKGGSTYVFFTTCHNTEDVIQIMKEKFGDRGYNNFSISRTVKGNKEVIFHQYKN